MAFDLASAKPVAEAAKATGFDLASAKPVVAEKDVPGAPATFIDAVGRHIAVPFKPEWNIENLATKITSALPENFLGFGDTGKSEKELQARSEAGATANPIANNTGAITGEVGSAYLTGKGLLSGADKLASLAKVRTASDLLKAGGSAVNAATKTPGRKLSSMLLDAGASIEKASPLAAETLQAAALFAEKNPRLAAILAARVLTGHPGFSDIPLGGK